MAQKPTPEFRSEAVRIALTSGLSRRQVAADLGILCQAGDACITEMGLFHAEPVDSAGPAQPFYNPRRRHSALGWKSPLAFEAQAA